MPARLLALMLLAVGLALAASPASAAPAHASASQAGAAVPVGALAGPALLGEVLAVPAPPRPPATPHPDDEELVVEQVDTSRYPRIALRFSLRPLSGQPPTYLEPQDVAILADGRLEPTLSVYTVGRVPTTGVGTYEATWTVSTPAEPGATIAGRLAVSVNGRPEIETRFSFIRPLPRQAEVVPIEQQAQALIPVPRPNPGQIDTGRVGAVAGVLAGTALLAVLAGLLWHARYRQAQHRLLTWVGRPTPLARRKAARAQQSQRKGLTLSPLVQTLGRLGARFMPSGQIEKMRRSLILAGRPTNQQYTRFIAAKTGLGLGLFGLGFWLMVSLAPFTSTLAVSSCMGLIGFLLPSIWLGRAIKQRQYEMRKALPDALDLMTIGVSAGLAFDGALSEIVEKWDNALSHEFNTVLGELRMGTGRRQALLNLTERTQVEEIQMMVSQLIQAEELGMSLTDTLLTLANQMRLKRRQRAEELAHKAAVKMLIPLVFLIFPALFVVILGPAAQDMYSFFTQGPK